MSLNKVYPPEFIRKMSMEAFEIVIRRLKELDQELAEAADASFLLWQLAEDTSRVAKQTICEMLPILIEIIYRNDYE